MRTARNAHRFARAALLAAWLPLAHCARGSAPPDGGDAVSATDASDASAQQDPPRPVIYQLVVRHFGNVQTNRTVDGTREQNGVGRFEDVNDRALASLRAMGFTHVWLTGVLRQATMTAYPALGLPADDADVVKGRAGSFYAIRDYYDVCPDYAADPAQRLAAFDALVERIHRAGMKVLIDFVPNHVARGYQSVVHPERDFGRDDDQARFFSARNDFFYLVDPPGTPLRLRRPAGWSPAGEAFDGLYERESGAAGRTARATGNRAATHTPSENDWYETVVLNYGLDFTNGRGEYSPPPSVWVKMDQVLAYWQARGVDGFRADFAHYVPDEAWRYLLSRVRERNPSAFVIAEAYDNLEGLLLAGFDAVYHDAAYDALKSIYQGNRTPRDFESTMAGISEENLGRYAHYLENHDERRVASPIVRSPNPDDSGFGGANAGRQLAPLLYLFGRGPVLFYNGQEVGEPAAGREGFGGEDGRTTLFDYWSLPALQGWVNGHAYDGAGLSEEQRALRSYYADLLALAQDRTVRRGRYWGLASAQDGGANGLYPFARFESGVGRVVLVVANFTPGMRTTGRVRLPQAMADAAGLNPGREYRVRLVLDHRGARDESVRSVQLEELVATGLEVTVEDQAASVFVLE